MNVVGLVKSYLVAELEDAVKEAMSPVGPYLKTLGMGMAMLLLASASVAGTVLFLVLALFFALSHLPVFAVASLWCALVMAVISLVTFMLAMVKLRQPRRS